MRALVIRKGYDVFVRAGTPAGDGGMALAGSIGDTENMETRDAYLLKTGLP